MDQIRKFAKIRVYTGYVFLLFVVLLADPSRLYSLPFLIVGSVFFAFGLIIRILAAGTLVKAEELVTGGIYQMTRNPLYLGSLFLGMGLTIMSAQSLLIILYFIIFLPIYNMMINMEEQFLSGAFGRDFEEYRKKVPKLFPGRGAPPGLGVNFSFARYRKNRELSGNIAFLAIAVIVWLKMLYQMPPIFHIPPFN
ncbi:isoprenylcysteine carboxylmethyltransferase family protein [bacterium]|nr:isoprenylcysteine carboxylmethyltransferase family protein [bacterium]